MEKSFEEKQGLLLSPGKNITKFTKQKNHQSASSWENMKNHQNQRSIHHSHRPLSNHFLKKKKWQQDSSMASPGAETSLHRAEISTGCPSYWPRTSGRTKRCDGSTGASWIKRFLQRIHGAKSTYPGTHGKWGFITHTVYLPTFGSFLW